MLRKIWAIASINIYTTFTDRNLLIIMIVTPLILATIISLAFGNMGGSSPITNIPVAIVNLDTPPVEGSQVVDSSGSLVSAFIPAINEANTDTVALGACDAVQRADSDETTANTYLTDLTEATLLDDPAAAKAGVDQGDYAAAVIIPAGFSESISYTQDDPAITPLAIEVYGDSAQPISAGIIRSIVEGFTNQLLTGQITIASTIGTMIDRARQNPAFGLGFAAAAGNGSFQPDFACAFTPGFNTIQIEQQSVTGKQADFNPLVVFGSAQAVFFALFTANGVAASIIEERRQWTLQRMVVSPTPRVLILTGKLIATFLVVMLQLAFLFIGFTVIGSLLEGEVKSVWGNDWLAIIGLILATSAATAGVGMFTAAIGKTAEQANWIGSIVSMLMGILGGAFFAVGVLGNFEWVTRLSVVRWGSEGFTKLASGQGDIGLNLVFLALIGMALFAVSLTVFARRQDI
ncbi:MAG: ABC transporter permease [Chloroflexi bacterium]|nr:ABC transporter permease [Chloroflexota bacterium]